MGWKRVLMPFRGARELKRLQRKSCEHMFAGFSLGLRPWAGESRFVAARHRGKRRASTGKKAHVTRGKGARHPGKRRVPPGEKTCVAVGKGVRRPEGKGVRAGEKGARRRGKKRVSPGKKACVAGGKGTRHPEGKGASSGEKAHVAGEKDACCREKRHAPEARRALCLARAMARKGAADVKSC